MQEAGELLCAQLSAEFGNMLSHPFPLLPCSYPEER